jgi:arylsulfatase A-like enzyme
MIRLPGEGRAAASATAFESDAAKPASPSPSRSAQFVYNLLDLGPTVLELAGIEAGGDERFHGRSLLPLLNGRMDDEAEPWRDSVVATYNGQQFGLFTQRMIRTSAWKYVWNLTDVDELYDLERDAAELHNLIGRPEYRELTADLRKRLYEQLKADGDPAVGNEWTRRQLLAGAILDTRD